MQASVSLWDDHVANAGELPMQWPDEDRMVDFDAEHSDLLWERSIPPLDVGDR